MAVYQKFSQGKYETKYMYICMPVHTYIQIYKQIFFFNLKIQIKKYILHVSSYHWFSTEYYCHQQIHSHLGGQQFYQFVSNVLQSLYYAMFLKKIPRINSRFVDTTLEKQKLVGN